MSILLDEGGMVAASIKPREIAAQAGGGRRV
jgi:hypothetical protein